MVDFSNALSRTSHVKVQAHWDPIADSTYNLHRPTPEKFKRIKENRIKQRFPELADMTWKQALNLFNLKPIYPLKDYNAVDFQAFLPSSIASVGDVWKLDPEGILPFLRQFHPGATMEIPAFSDRTRRSEGGKACLRAISPDYAEVTSRIHAQFKLDVCGARFMPAQFAGCLILNRKTGKVVKFSLSLPPRNSNVDINAYGAADIVFVPRMELSALLDAPAHEITWETAITEEEARKKLKLAFYKSAEIEWTPIGDTLELAKSTNRPIHGLVLFGTFDDESC